MPSCHRRVTSRAIQTALTLLVVASVVTLCQVAEAQTTALATNRAVGGVSIDPAGMLTTATFDEFGALRKVRLQIIGAIPDGLQSETAMRKISLRRLDEAIRQCLEGGRLLPPEIECLGGLQRVRYVLVYPDEHDIVLVGPAEGWKVNDRGVIVGATTGRPVMLLDDLIVALRAANGPVRSVISCSINPTPEGLQRLSAFNKRLPRNSNPQAAAMGIEQQLGPQAVSITGVPDTSHFARVMVAADYRMKRVSMETEPAPIRGLPGFIGMMRAAGRKTQNMMPRWWLAPDYEPLLRDADGLAWELRGASVKALSETEFLDAAGVRRQTGRADSISQKWAEIMTERYDELALADPVFGQLQNCMDLAIVAALIVGQDLPGVAQVRLPMLMDAGGLEVAEMPAPKQVESKATLARKGRDWMIACGGVEINAWAIVEKADRSEALANVRIESGINSRTERWWD